jgi:amino acid adenylation domain-containing protein
VITHTDQFSSERLALTTTQVPLWLEQLYLPGKPIANTGLSVTLRGHLDVPTFVEAIRLIVNETDTLRICLRMEDNSVYQSVVDLPDYLIEQVDFSQSSDPAAAADAWIESHLWQTIAWDAFPLFEHTLIKLSARHHIWLQKSNHLVIDGVGRQLLVRRTSEVYEALRKKCQPNAPGGMTTAQLVAASQRYLSSDARGRDLSYFHKRFEHLPTSLIRNDFRHSERDKTGRCTRIIKQISTREFEELKALAQMTGCSVSRILLTLVFVSLHRLYRLDDVAVGFALHNRTTPVFKETIALFTQNLPIRSSIPAETSFSTLIGQVNAAVEQARPHGRFPLSELNTLLKSARQGRGLYEVLFNYIPPAQESGFNNVSIETVTLSHGFFLPLNITCSHPSSQSAVRLTLDYDSGLINGEEASRLLQCIHVLCTTIGPGDLDESVDRLQIVDAQERATLLDELNRTSVDFPEELALPDLLRAQVDRAPDAIAVVCGNDQITFLALYTRARALAAQLAEIGVTTGSVVGVALARNVNLIVALVAIHEVGAAYLPLDPAYPADRLSYLVDDSKASLVLVDKLTAPALPAVPARIARLEELSAPRDSATMRRAAPDDLAYVLYTSGSTGHPKAVGVQHRNVVNLIFCLRTLVQEEDLKGVLFSTSLNFDISVYEIFLPLIFGGRMIIVDNLLTLPAIAARDEVRLINTGPSLMAALIALGWTPDGVRTINLAGEPLPRRLADKIFEANPKVALFNLYGPTETTVYSTYARILPSDQRPPAIGRPLWNTQLYVLGPQGGLLPKGAIGELYIGGAGVSRGYLGRPALTRDRFIANPFGEGILYRTGDLVRWRTDNELEYLGRDDGQIKIHGQRVEIGEIEKQIDALPGIASTVILAQPDGTGGQTLHAYAIAKAGQPYDFPKLIVALARTLPRHMLPSTLTWMERFPMLPNGKLDRRAFPVPQAMQISTSFQPPSTEAESKLVAIWKEVLELERVGVQDNFYDLGGTSLQGFMIFARIAERLQISLPPATMLRAPTIFLQAQLIDQSSGDTGDEDSAIVQFRGEGSREPLFLVHDGWGGIMFVRDLAKLLKTDRAIYGLRPPPLDGKHVIPRTIEAIAADYLQEIRQRQAHGPYLLAGYSFGGFVAFEMARQLTALGESVRFLGIIDASKPSESILVRGLQSAQKNGLSSLLQKGALAGLHYVRWLGEALRAWSNTARLVRGLPLAASAVHCHYRFIYGRAVKQYRTQSYPGKVTVFSGSNREKIHDARWREVAADVEVHEVGGSHTEIVSPNHSGILARRFDEALDGPVIPEPRTLRFNVDHKQLAS